jgi:hypothetical protein
MVRIDEDPALHVEIDAAHPIAVDEVAAGTAEASAGSARKALEVRLGTIGTAQTTQVLELAEEGVGQDGVPRVAEFALKGRCPARQHRGEERKCKTRELHAALSDLSGLTDRRSAASAADRGR